MNKQPETPEEQAAQEALEELEQAMKKYAQARANMEGHGQILMTAGFAAYEFVNFENDENTYRVKYTFTGPISLSAALGLVHLAADCVEVDLYGRDEDDE